MAARLARSHPKSVVPGTGKSVIKEAIRQKADKRMVVVSVNRTMHTYTNTLKILCGAFGIDHEGVHVTCEKRILEEAHALNRSGKMLVTIIDEAHLMDIDVLRKLRLMFDEFPKNHNLILTGQTQLIGNMSLKANEDIRSRITYSVALKKLNPDDMLDFMLAQLDAVGLGHNTFSQEAAALIVRTADGIIRRTRNLCISCLLEAVRDRKRTVDLDTVNAVLIQPHWRNDYDLQS
ncbi:MAG: AAA family ATPase [Chitinivibrionales bacterium]|nr:AAA family ATPase [Chitinivibrionales bacterium]MBD3355556.1 AAA family ATPase [Chitinivibrionales bacterium]